jgi:hypothetical protein
MLFSIFEFALILIRLGGEVCVLLLNLVGFQISWICNDEISDGAYNNSKPKLLPKVY